jgi:hypothetical protein
VSVAGPLTVAVHVHGNPTVGVIETFDLDRRRELCGEGSFDPAASA